MAMVIKISFAILPGLVYNIYKDIRLRAYRFYAASIQIYKLGICRAVKVRGRLDALPPAFTRGVAKVAHTGAGGSPSSAFVSQKGAKNKNSNHRKIILFDALVPGIRTPPVPALAQGHPPHKCGGQGIYPLAYQNSPTNSNLGYRL